MTIIQAYSEKTINSTDETNAPANPETNDKKTGTDVVIDRTIDARQRILVVAISMFSSNGYEGVSTTQIAKASGVTQPLIHYHFKSKFSLWKACVSQAFKWLDSEFIQPVKLSLGEDVTMNVEMMINKFVHFASARPEFARFLLSEGSQQSERLDWMVSEYVKPLTQEFESAYFNGVESGLIRRVPMAQLVSIVLGAATQFYAWKPMLVSAWSVDPEDSEQSKVQQSVVIEFIKNAVLSSKL